MYYKLKELFMKKLTKAEEQVMQTIWEMKSCMVSEILEQLGEPKPPHSTVSSVVRILEKKGFVQHKAYGRTHVYSPVITKDEYTKFTLDKEGFLEKVSAFAGFNDIDIENHDDFSDRFYLQGENKIEISKFFNDDVTHFFESNPYYHVESNGNALLIFGKERLASLKEIKALFDFGKRLKEVIS